MADFDSQLPIRSLAANNTTKVADSAGATIDPAKEAGNLLDVKTSVQIMDDWDRTGDRAATDLEAVGGTVVEKGYGSVSTGSQRVAAMLGLGSAAVSNSNPIPVNIVGGGGTNTHSYDTSTSIAAAASDTHVFTPAANFLLREIYYAASGQMKIEIQWGTTGGETTKTVAFTSKGGLTGCFKLSDPQLIAPTETINVIRTNLDNQAMDVYSSIHGLDA